MAPRKFYKPEQMKNAIEAVRNGETVFAASKRFGVPRITLRNKITGKSPLDCRMGPPSILTNEQENLFAEWVHKMSDNHCPVGKENLLDSVEYFVEQENIVNPFTENRPGKKWYNSFSKRNPEVAKRISENWWKSKDNITEQKIRAWFTNINQYLKKKGLQKLLKDPRRIFTSDEAAFYLDPKHERALVKRNETNIYSALGNEKEHPKVYLTANAAGELAPPMIVFPYHRIPPYTSRSIPEEWGIGRSKIGWMSANTLYEYITDVFHPWLIENDVTLPVIYFLDGDATHLTRHLSEFCAENQIELLCLYPNSNHILKTMDVAIFRPLRAFWKRQCTMWQMKNLEEIKKENFASILENALQSITADCIRNGFKISGIFPFSPRSIDFTKLTSVNRAKALNSFQFLNTLEKEIVSHFTQEKLDTFNTTFNMETEDAENDIPKEDTSLYTIWAKYKHAYKSKLIDNVGKAEYPVISKSVKRFRSSSPDYKIAANKESLDKICLNSSENEYNSEGDTDDCKPSYLNISRESSETPKKLPNPFSKKLLQNKRSTAIKQFWSNEESNPLRLKKPGTLTVKTWRELNKKKLVTQTLLSEKYIKQEPLDKRDIDLECETTAERQQIVNRRKRAVPDECEESICKSLSKSDEDLKELPNRKDIIDKNTKVKEEVTVQLDKQNIDDDSVIICVTDDDVKILYY